MNVVDGLKAAIKIVEDQVKAVNKEIEQAQARKEELFRAQNELERRLASEQKQHELEVTGQLDQMRQYSAGLREPITRAGM